MKILFLDLASNSASDSEGACIACVECEALAEHETLSEAERSRRVSASKTQSIVFADHRVPDDQLLPTVERALTQANWTDRDLTHIACVTGPGGFTSLRVAVTLANTFADQLALPVVGVHLSDLYESRVTSHELRENKTLETRDLCSRNFVWLHSTKKTHLFICGFGEHAFLWPDPVLISVEDLAAQLPEGSSIIGEILPEHREAIAGKHPEYPVIAPIPEILPAFLANLPYTQSALTPWYGRGW
jgi:tRNA A37 threonylcarbamoyladenosine modification protein TsaB